MIWTIKNMVRFEESSHSWTETKCELVFTKKLELPDCACPGTKYSKIDGCKIKDVDWGQKTIKTEDWFYHYFEYGYSPKENNGFNSLVDTLIDNDYVLESVELYD